MAFHTKKNPSKNRVKYRRVQAAAHEIEYEMRKLGQTPYEGDAHSYLMSIYKDRAAPRDLRLKAAVAALPYEKPKLMAVALNDQIGHTFDRNLTLRFVGTPVEPVEKVIEHDDAETVTTEPRKKLRFVS